MWMPEIRNSYLYYPINAMPKNTKTYLFCYDDHRGFAEDVKKRFADDTRYRVLSYPTTEEFINHIEKEKGHNLCKIAILGVHETHEQIEMIENLTMQIKRIDPGTGLILIGPPEKMDEIKKTIKFNIDAYIPKNANSILRMHNIVKKLISEHNIGIYKKRRNLSMYFLITVMLISALFLIFAIFRLPSYF